MYAKGNSNLDIAKKEEETCFDYCNKCGIHGYKEQWHDDHDKDMNIH